MRVRRIAIDTTGPPKESYLFNMSKRKAKELDNGTAEKPRRSSRRISTTNEPPETPAKPAPTPKKPKKTNNVSKDKRPMVNGKAEEDAESVSFVLDVILPTQICSWCSGGLNGHVHLHLRPPKLPTTLLRPSYANANARGPRKPLKQQNLHPSPRLLVSLHPAVRTGF